MSTKRPDRIPIQEWRNVAETIGQMHATGWAVISKCNKCGLMMNVRLDDLIALRGPKLSLWNRKARCKKIGCEGWVEFQGKPPGVYIFSTLTAPDRRP